MSSHLDTSCAVIQEGNKMLNWDKWDDKLRISQPSGYCKAIPQGIEVSINVKICNKIKINKKKYIGLRDFKNIESADMKKSKPFLHAKFGNKW